MTPLEAFTAAAAVLITVVATGAILLAAWRAGTWAWREHRAKRRRPGYLNLQPTPDRPRLGLTENRGRTAGTAGRTTRRSEPSWHPKR